MHMGSHSVDAYLTSSIIVVVDFSIIIIVVVVLVPFLFYRMTSQSSVLMAGPAGSMDEAKGESTSLAEKGPAPAKRRLVRWTGENTILLTRGATGRLIRAR